MADGWKNRIVRTDESVDPEQLLANPYNWRVHSGYQKAAMAEVLDRVGWLDRVKVNVTTGHVVNGHMRIDVAMKRGETVPVDYVELDEEEERLALLTYDPIGALAGEDRGLLAELVREAGGAGADLTRMGYEAKDVERLVQFVARDGDAGPEAFREYDPDTIDTNHLCPKCGYRWSE